MLLLLVLHKGEERMKKMTIGLLCLIAIMSCDIPQSITVKGSPGVYLPLGSPFSRLDDTDRLENRINPDKIKEMLSKSETDDTAEVEIYDYQGPDVNHNVQAYIVHYPIVAMKLDLQKHIDDAAKIDDETHISHTLEPIIDSPSFSTQFPQGAYLTGTQGPQKTEDRSNPLFKVSLANMTKLVKEVRVTMIGLEMKYDNDVFAQNVLIKIPAFGINDYIPGSPVNGNKVQFFNDQKNKFTPKPESKGGDLNEKNEIEIFVKVTGPCSGTIVPEMILEWTDATVYASDDDSIKGTHTIKNELGEFLGEGNSFEKVTGYVYMHDLDKASMSLNYNNKPLAAGSLESVNRPNFPIEGEIPVHSLDSESSIDLTEVFLSEATLSYEVKIETWEISNDQTTREKTITADLIILLPLEFKITALSPDMPDYARLELKKLFPEPKGGDLFMRTGKNNSDDLLNNLDTVKITLKNFQNDITDDFHLLIASGNYRNSIDLSSQDNHEPSLKIDWEDIPYPFSPKFEILLEREKKIDGQYENYALLKIKRQPPNPKFDFILTVEATANINHTMDL
jgi:hypothetical protein